MGAPLDSHDPWNMWLQINKPPMDIVSIVSSRRTEERRAWHDDMEWTSWLVGIPFSSWSCQCCFTNGYTVVCDPCESNILPRKSMVVRWNVLLGRSIFKGYGSFREGIICRCISRKYPGFLSTPLMLNKATKANCKVLIKTFQWPMFFIDDDKAYILESTG